MQLAPAIVGDVRAVIEGVGELRACEAIQRVRQAQQHDFLHLGGLVRGASGGEKVQSGGGNTAVLDQVLQGCDGLARTWPRQTAQRGIDGAPDEAGPEHAVDGRRHAGSDLVRVQTAGRVAIQILGS